MRVRPSLRYGMLGVLMLSFASLSLLAQDTPTATPWGASEKAADSSWDSAEATADAWDTSTSDKTVASSWDAAEATAEAEAWDMDSTDKAADSSWDMAEATAEAEAWDMDSGDSMAGWDESALTLVWQSAFTPETALYAPGDIGIDTDGNVYVSTQSSNTVKKFDKDGNFVLEWGGNGDGEGKFTLSLGVGVDAENNVYVTDFYNRRIQKFDSDGKFLLEWPNEPSTSPAFLAVDPQGHVYVDQFPPRGEHYVQKFDGWGMLLAEWGAEDKKFGGRIEDIAVDQDGNLYVADAVLHRIQKLDPNGKVLATFGDKISTEGNGKFDTPFGIAVDNEGYMYVLDNHFLQKLDWEGNCVAQWPKSGELEKAVNVAVDSEGYIYVFANSDVTAVNGNTVSVPLLKKFQQAES